MRHMEYGAIFSPDRLRAVHPRRKWRFAAPQVTNRSTGLNRGHLTHQTQRPTTMASSQNSPIGTFFSNPPSVWTYRSFVPLFPQIPKSEVKDKWCAELTKLLGDSDNSRKQQAHLLLQEGMSILFSQICSYILGFITYYF